MVGSGRFYGPQKAYEVMEKKDAGSQEFYCYRSLEHGGWAGAKQKTWAKFSLEHPQGKIPPRKNSSPWFAYYLKGRAMVNLPKL